MRLIKQSATEIIFVIVIGCVFFLPMVHVFAQAINPVEDLKMASSTAAASRDYEITKKTDGEINNCKISVISAYLWRDFMPIIDNPGPDGGKPMYVSVSVRFDNSQGDKKRLSWQGYVGRYKRFNHVTFTIGDNDQRQIDIKAGQVLDVDFVAHDGPYLPVGSETCAMMEFTDLVGSAGSGSKATISTDPVRIARTD